MNSFALYRLPHEKQCTLIEQCDGQPAVLNTYAELDTQQGFVMAPFAIQSDAPLLVIRPDKVTVLPQDDLHFAAKHFPFCRKMASVLPQNRTHFAAKWNGNDSETPVDRAVYAIDFSNFHAQLCNGVFRKLVLARCAAEPLPPQLTPIDMFQCACRLYPRLFIALVYTPQSGLWLTATPEILLDSVDGRRWRTIALAGTMRLKADEMDGEGQHLDWSVKNIEEQRIVAAYMAKCLEQFTDDFTEEGPRTVRAAHLVHLRSDFTFTLLNNARVGDLLQALHPTPAVCGLPKREAQQFIISNEQTPRRYYSGFMGPFNMPSSSTPHLPPSTFHHSSSTHLFVSLRCMQITDSHCLLYAGGGLLKDSTEEQEWQETEAKLETMRRCLT